MCQPATKGRPECTQVAIRDQEGAERHLRENVVPGVSQAPGFVAGYSTRKGDSRLAMVILESAQVIDKPALAE